MKHFTFALLALCLTINSSFAGEQPANSDVALEDSFDRDELGEGWNTGKGEWKIVNGVLRGREIASEMQAAATRRVVETQNAVYELRFRFVEGGKALHFGFDPAKGELKKKGHLFSVVITPASWKVLKHVDKDRPKEDPNVTLGEQKRELKAGEWHTLRVTTWGNYVTAQIDDGEPLKVSHATFGVKKPTLVFRCLGDGVEINDLHVWTQRGK